MADYLLGTFRLSPINRPQSTIFFELMSQWGDVGLDTSHRVHITAVQEARVARLETLTGRAPRMTHALKMRVPRSKTGAPTRPEGEATLHLSRQCNPAISSFALL
jgi:hypothetical protein